MAKDSIPSMAVAVVKDGAILWEEGFGRSDAARTVATSSHTPYYLASVTKTITATAIMTLAERRRLNIDRSANDYLRPSRRLTSGGPWLASSATVRHLLTHTSGLTTFDWTCYPDQPRCRVLATDSLIARYGVLMFPPGEHFDYTNLGFGVLGEIVSQVDGRPFKAALKELVFAPLGMSDASLGVDSTRLGVTAVRVSAARGAHLNAASGSPGGSAVYASAHDLARFALLHLKGSTGISHILRNETVNAMQSTTVPTDNPGSVYGLGWYIYPDRHGARILSAQGGTDDAYASVLLVPEARLGVVVLANTGSAAPSTVIDAVFDEMLPGYHDRRVADSVAATHVLPKGAMARPASSFIGTWKGSIATPHGRTAMELLVDTAGNVRARIGDGRDTVFRAAHFGALPNGVAFISGRLSGDLATPEDIGPGPYEVYVELYYRNGALNGLATSYPSSAAPFGARLSYAVVLQRG